MGQPPATPPSLPDQIRTRIATEVLRKTVPALLLMLILGLLMVWMAGGGHESRFITIAVLVMALVVVWRLIRSGRVTVAANVFTASLCLAVLTGMIINGGVLAPAFVGAIPVVAIIGWLYGVRPASMFLIGVVATGGLLVWMDHEGWLRHPPAPPPVMVWVIFSTYLVITFCATALPNRLLHQALADSEARRRELEATTRELAEREATLLKAEEALRHEKSLTDAIFDSVPGLLYMHDGTGRLVRWNRKTCEILGLTDEELSRWQLGDGLSPEDRQRAVEAAHKVLRDGAGTVEVDLITRSGPVPFYFTGVRTEINGKPHLLGVGIDITERKRAEEALRREKTLTDAIFDMVPGLLAMYDDQGRIVRWNAKGRRELVGPGDRDLSQWRFGDALAAEDRERVHGLVQRIMREGREEVAEANLLTTRGPVPHLFTGVRVMLDGKPHLLGIGVDITERKRAEEHLRHALAQAEAASRAKDQFLAAASHELRTPLTPVLLLASSLEADTGLPPDVRHDLGVIREHIELEKRLIGDLLDFTAIHAGKLQIHPVPTDVHDVLRAALRTCQEEADRKRLRLDVRLGARHHHTTGDPDRLRQVFWNLLQNACKFTPDGCAISVRTTNDTLDDGGRALRVEVADAGRGMDAETLRRLFRPFEQGPRDERMQHYGGLGLGLAISKTLVEAHGGSISATSEGPGRGSTFVVRLPLVPARAAAPPAPRGVAPAQPARLKLLLVEDHPLTLKTLARLLAAEGHRVTTAMTAAEALRVAAGDRFDLILSDIGLPDGSGLELMSTLRDRYELPGIALSGFGADADVEASRHAGVLTHVTKPVTIEALRDVLSQFAATRPAGSPV